MSQSWRFCSYSQPRLNAMLGGGEPNAADQLTEAVMWDAETWRDPSLLQRTAERIAHDGINYAGLSRQEAECLDQMLPIVFSPEGLSKQLEVEPESPDGLYPLVVQELLTTIRHEGHASRLRVLLNGRRFGATDVSNCGYCFLSLHDCELLLAEVRHALSGRPRWSQRSFPEVVEESLVGPLQSAITKGRPIFGSLS
jgi:hypothetical protein